MSRAAALPPLLLALALTAAAPALAPRGGAAGQGLVLALHQARSGWDAYRSPTGVALEVSTPSLAFVRAVGGVRGRRDVQRRDGTTCDQYWPVFEACASETVETRVREGAWYGGLEMAAAVGPLEVQAARLWGRVDPDGRSEGTRTGRSAGDVFPDRPTSWAAWRVGVRWTGSWALPGGPVARLERVDGLDFGGCVADAGAPLCGAEDVWALEVGWAFTPRP